jgi:hypothetical protein
MSRANPQPGRMVARRMLDDPGLARTVLQTLAAGRNGVDARLRARRYVETRLGVGPKDGISDASYRRAAAALKNTGQAAEAEALEAIASVGAELRAAHREWRDRYANRPRTEAEVRAMTWMSGGRIRTAGNEGVTGADGAWYHVADLMTESGTVPAVVMTTRSGFVEVVDGFAADSAMRAWLRDRARGRTGPLASCATGPACRAMWEEQVLAWLLQNGGGSGEGWRPQAFTTYSRSEIFLAWRAVSQGTFSGADIRLVEGELDRRLLRAPGWAIAEIGWPRGQNTIAFLGRLAVTAVTTTTAQLAARQLVSQDRAVRRPGSKMSADRPSPAPGGEAAQVAATQFLLEPPPPTTRPPGPAPRI